MADRNPLDGAISLLNRAPLVALLALDLSTGAAGFAVAMVVLPVLLGFLAVPPLLGIPVYAAFVLWRTLRGVFGARALSQAAGFLVGERDRDDTLFPPSELRRARVATAVAAGPFVAFFVGMLPAAFGYLVLVVAVTYVALLAVRSPVGVAEQRVEQQEVPTRAGPDREEPVPTTEPPEEPGMEEPASAAVHVCSACGSASSPAAKFCRSCGVPRGR